MKNIFLVEDDADDQYFFIEALNNIKNTSLFGIANNGKDALAKLMHSDLIPDIIFMDVGMPQIDGLEVTRIIRKEFKSQPVIVAITANALQGDKEICLAAGMDDYLSKPLHFESMVKILEKWAKAIQNKVA